jgi:lipid A 3-O-deacylase
MIRNVRSCAVWAYFIVLAFIIVCGAASAADLQLSPSSASAIIFAPPILYHPERFELRGGAFAHAVSNPESGSADANIEVVAPRFFLIPGVPDFLTPRFHIGGIINTAGKTSYVYAGALWTYNLGRWFVEGFFGGLIHDGNLDDTADDMNGLGCRWAFHSGGSLGYRIDDHWSVMGTFDHLSNAETCQYNKGINDYGLRAAYSF